ncbi:radical SAM family heme chaperone HemW [Roseovarius sp. W115]|uniref:Heme chaperone HemW n=1 Tax=Roseovarius rhodophyticola TaxID=3080827 RepID=A0ABZ2TKX2_9RHOB|nr:radical SAM family heme chaperone HemW [Roseovarius sp. W115]MDV2930067.1 radical SAM family heme chaperone HemW [Roseovarius sp. W115]
MIEDWRHGGFGLYIHWPFCESKCPYCDFNSHVQAKIDQKQWLKAYLSEIDRYGNLLPNRLLNSVFFGGGTPSLMQPELVGQILDRVHETWRTANDLEVTLEANPSSVEAEKFSKFAKAGVNRVSLGVQALDDSDLKRLGRLHSAEDAKTALNIAQSTFERVSFDLIYARQDQSLSAWEKELEEALLLAGDHLSLYQLTIEPGTAFGERDARGLLKGLPSEDGSADMFELTQKLCQFAGFDAYEVSNHAKPGSESRHNLIYWRGGDYIGIGPGAHGRVTLGKTRYATECWSQPSKWLAEVDSGTPEKSRDPLSYLDQASELLLMGLRLSEGVSLDRVRSLTPQALPEASLDELRQLDLITTKARTIRTTFKGRMMLNAVVRTLMPG